MSPPREPQGLYLIAPPALSPDRAAELVGALARRRIACVLLDGASPDLIAAVQATGAAALIRNGAQASADGVHIRHPVDDDEQALTEAVRQARAAQGASAGIVGIGGLRTRHQAMSAGERDVDYVMFGEPDEAGVMPAPDAVRDRVEWWAGIFTVPCVAFAARLADAAALFEADADFVALGAAVFDDPRGIAAALDEALAIASAIADPVETAS